jgi:hypothetical protein
MIIVNVRTHRARLLELAHFMNRSVMRLDMLNLFHKQL